jgi:hypothetical protein
MVLFIQMDIPRAPGLGLVLDQVNILLKYFYCLLNNNE